MAHIPGQPNLGHEPEPSGSGIDWSAGLQDQINEKQDSGID